MRLTWIILTTLLIGAPAFAAAAGAGLDRGGRHAGGRAGSGGAHRARPGGDADDARHRVVSASGPTGGG